VTEGMVALPTKSWHNLPLGVAVLWLRLLCSVRCFRLTAATLQKVVNLVELPGKLRLWIAVAQNTSYIGQRTKDSECILVSQSLIS
jgi:hypothetical protein